ncbi:MAG: hypothetical protein ABW215_11150 [Kibdelosporangium sp.]
MHGAGDPVRWREHRAGELGRSDAALLIDGFEADQHGTEGEPPRFVAASAEGFTLLPARDHSFSCRKPSVVGVTMYSG